MTPGVVIVGAGHAGARCAHALRQAGYAGSVTLLGDEGAEPYERPPLSKSFLLEDGRLAPIAPAASYAAAGIVLRPSARAIAIDPAARRVDLADGASIDYRHLVLATGSVARMPAFTGHEPGDVLALRNAADAARLRKVLRPGQRVLLIGGGFVGLEVAASATRLGCRVTVVEKQPRLLPRAVSAWAAERVLALHAGQGVEVRLGRAPVDIVRAGPAFRYVLDDGTQGEADVVLAGMGAMPDVALAERAGLAMNPPPVHGVLVDAACRTSAQGIHAIGDIAAPRDASGGCRIRLESWENAERQAARAAAAIVRTEQGDEPSPAEAAADEAPWFWTDQFDMNLQIVGWPAGATRYVAREAGAGKAVGFHFDAAGVLGGAELFNSGRGRRIVRQLVAAGRGVAAAELADPAVPLATALRNAQQRGPAAAPNDSRS